MARHDFDLFVIGAGSGGVRAARTAAGLGARVAIAEDRYFGGTCVNVGCVPKKLFTYAAHYGEAFHEAAGYGWRAGPASFDWPTLLRNKDAEIARLNGIYEHLLTGAGCTVLNGRARLLDATTVDVGGRAITAERILVATGGWPVVPDVPGRELAITSNEAFHLPALPRRIAIVGGGYIAVEFAGIFHGLGVETTLVHRGELFLRGFDLDLRAHLAREMQRTGVGLRFDTHVTDIARGDGGLDLTLDDRELLQVDAVMYATGRAPASAGLGLEEVGVRLRPGGAIEVDAEYRTSVPNIYAIGDVTDRVNLTPVALAEGMVLARRLYGGPQGAVDYDNIPTAVFSHPNLGTVGPTEEAARARYGDVAVYRSTYTPMKQSLTGTGEKTLMKLIVDRATDRVVAAHMCGPDAGEIIQGIAIAIRAGATKALFDTTIGIHPTAAEEFVTMRTPVA